VIFVPANTVPARSEAIRGEGAEVRVVAGTYDDAVRECARLSAANGWQVVSDTGYEGYEEVPRWVVDGYGTIFEEFDEQTIAKPDFVIMQAGVGGLLCAAVRHFVGRAKIVSVEPEDADCLLESIASPDGHPATARGSQNSLMACLNCGEPSSTAWPEIRASVDLFLAVEDTWAVEAMRRFYLGEPRITAGESGAAGLAGLLAICADPALRAELGLTEQSRVLLVNTEGATDPENFARLRAGWPESF
jgi:diaminopropionate ammonia-lyase